VAVLSSVTPRSSQLRRRWTVHMELAASQHRYATAKYGTILVPP